MTAFTCSAPGADGADGAGAIISWSSATHGNSTSAVYYHAWNSGAGANTTNEPNGEIAIPLPGTIAQYSQRTAALGTANVTYTVRINGVDTAITCTINAGGTSGSDGTHSASVAAGDVVSLKSVASAADNTTANPAGFLLYTLT